MSNAVIYARFSTDRQDARSIDDQKRRCTEFAARHQMTVVETYADEAMSGSHTARPDLQRLLTDARQSKGRAFSAVLVDDLSRLSRDLWGMGSMVFGELAAANVCVVDVMTGMASDAPQARQMFAAMGMSNDFFLQMVKTETHRGLEGRALAGFWTGGRVYGYSTKPEENPPDPQHPRAVPFINDVEAEQVRRIFVLYLEGHGFAAIAMKLNAEGCRAPYDGVYSKRAGRGWQASTVRNIILNERYIGRFIWNKRKFIRGANGVRLPKDRPSSEWKSNLIPSLAIIDETTFATAQERMKANKHRNGGRPSPRIPTLLGGLLRCGVCGAGMSVYSARVKNGVRYANYRCGANQTKGSTVCDNGAQISEKKLRDGLIATLNDLFARPGIVRRFIEKFTTRVTAAKPHAPGTEVVAQIEECERTIANLSDAVGRMGFSEALASRLSDAENRLRLLKAKRAEVEAATRWVEATPHPVLIRDYLANLAANLETDARALVRKHVGLITLTPKEKGPERIYQASGALKLFLPMTSSVNESNYCGGPLSQLSVTEMPFEYSVVRGRAA
jgi:site-specific DNA recombinase